MPKFILNCSSFRYHNTNNNIRQGVQVYSYVVDKTVRVCIFFVADNLVLYSFFYSIKRLKATTKFVELWLNFYCGGVTYLHKYMRSLRWYYN